ncbi:hypothetical protein [Streptomyces sp. NRRL F-5123]|uniref:hypothetical protein n=1 Tax=Streptomyces sp. NRRL F-5123 TaxID=1463856 RepID=UPI0004E233F3|nr:hypothetical protein [Streptomyces sp. NRRL F-5123]
MTARTRRRSAIPEFHPGQILDWSSSAHWDYDGPGPCRYCGQPTRLLDSHRHHAHKTCAEAALAAQYAQAQADYQDGAL